MNEMFSSQSYYKKNILRTFKPENLEKLRTAQPEPKFTGSYKNKSV